jgi:hypothetical protein
MGRGAPLAGDVDGPRLYRHRGLCRVLGRGAAGHLDRIDVAGWAAILAGCALFLVIGFGGAWAASGALRLDRRERISFLFAGAQKSIAMGRPWRRCCSRPRSPASSCCRR